MKHVLIWMAALGVAAAQGLPTAPVDLSLKRAVELAVSPEGSARIQISDEAVKQAQSRSAQAKAALLPDIESSFSVESRTENLAALGLGNLVTIPIPGFQIPTFVGPFTTTDARVTGSQAVFDFSSIRRFQASKEAISAARSDGGNTAEQVAAQVALAYLAAVKGDTDVESARANVTLSEALERQAELQKEAGTGTGIEITRAKVRAYSQRQSVAASAGRRKCAPQRPPAIAARDEPAARYGRESHG